MSFPRKRESPVINRDIKTRANRLRFQLRRVVTAFAICRVSAIDMLLAKPAPANYAVTGFA